MAQDINAARARSSASLPPGESPVRQPLSREPTPFAPTLPSLPSSGPQTRTLLHPGNAAAGHDFALGTCTPCHVVASDQKSPVRFADAPDFRLIANAPRTTAVGLNIWLTNPHPTMPKLTLDPQEAADVIAYLLSLRERG